VAVSSGTTQTSGTTATSPTAGTFIRDPGGASFTDPDTGEFSVWYERVEPDGSTTLFLLPETGGVPDLTAVNEQAGIPIPAGGFDLDFNLDFSSWPPASDQPYGDWGPMFTEEELAAIEAGLAQPSTDTGTGGSQTDSAASVTQPAPSVPNDSAATSGGNAPPADTGVTLNLKGFSINIFTLVRTVNGLIPAWYLKVGDKLLSADIESFPYDNLLTTDMNLIEWTAQNPQINLVETEIVSLRTRIAKWAIMVDSDMFSDSHYILIKRNDVTKFVKAIDLEPTDLIWSNSDQNWVGIGLLRKVEVDHEVLSIDCEPYDIFFTERMLTHDSSTVD
jgi:hypothetical protein